MVQGWSRGLPCPVSASREKGEGNCSSSWKGHTHWDDQKYWVPIRHQTYLAPEVKHGQLYCCCSQRPEKRLWCFVPGLPRMHHSWKHHWRGKQMWPNRPCPFISKGCSGMAETIPKPSALENIMDDPDYADAHSIHGSAYSGRKAKDHEGQYHCSGRYPQADRHHGRKAGHVPFLISRPHRPKCSVA